VGVLFDQPIIPLANSPSGRYDTPRSCLTGFY
jgi:hypothetical protein